jgi:hypothetical protein
MNMWLMLAELSPADRNKVIAALAIMLVLVFAGFFGIMIFRRKLTSENETDSSADVGFSLSDLRRMRDDGEITPEEYEITRAKVVAKVRSSLGGKPKKGTGAEKDEPGLSS